VGDSSAYAPLRHPLFRWLFIASVASNIGTWMQNVGAAWLMTDLSSSSLLVGLVQTATNLPVFILAIPAGALADIVDRRWLLLVSQVWMLVVAIGLAALTFAGMVTPWLLLALTFLLGVGFALTAPAWLAITPELVSRDEVPAAVALNGVSMNAARAIGPALGGFIVAAASPAAAFMLNAISFVGVLVVLARWRRPHAASVLPTERLIGAMRVGLRHVRHSPAMRAVFVRTTAFIVGASGLWALLPVITRQDPARGAMAYGILLGCLGAGAVIGAGFLPGLRRRFGPNAVVTGATVVFAAVTLILAWVPYFSVWCVVFFLGGAAWLCCLATLNAIAQTAVPRWVEARALAIYLLMFFGGMAAGGVLWGILADHLGTSWALTASAASALAEFVVAFVYRLPSDERAGLDPSRHWAEVTAAPGIEMEHGPVMVTVDYRIDPERRSDFLDAIQPLRQARLRDGAVAWELYQDATDPGLYVETFLDETWVAHLRHHERVTEADRIIEDRVKALLQVQPLVRHLVAARRR
jgi:MFS family permease/quinol monooxygenase YgiN